MTEPSVLFIGKRHYTGKDTLIERFGRLFHLPLEWSRLGAPVRLWLVDYHGRKRVQVSEEGLGIESTPLARLSFARRFFAELLRRPRADVVVASGDCYLGLLGWVVARLRGSRFIFDVYDKYDEFGGYHRPLGWDLFGFLLARADVCLFASAALAARLADRVDGRALLVRNGVDPAVFRPIDSRAARRELGLDAAVEYVGYFGGMEHDRGVQDLVEAVAIVRADGRATRLLLCGHRHADSDIDREWIDYRGAVPHATMPLYINACDAVAVPYRRSEFMDMGSSCKIAEYLLCERPLVATATPNFTANFPRQAAELEAMLGQPGDPAGLARALRLALDAPTVATPPFEMAWKPIAREAWLGAIAVGPAR